MSIASRITEIETHIGDVYDTINYSYDTTGVNKNIINIPKYLKKGYIDIINNGIDTLYNNFPKVSGIGSNLSLTPTYEAPMKLNEIQGDTLQDGTPTPDSPVPIQSVTGLQNIEVCGKNLINSVVKNGNRLFFNGGSDAGTSTFKAGTYTISYTSQNTITTYIKNTDGTQTNLGTNKTITFTSNKDFDLWLYRSEITIEEVSNIQLEQGSTATDYEPYKGNTYEVNLGKNLFSSEMELGTLNNSTGLPATETNCIRTKDYISVNPNTTYIISNNKGYQQIVYQYDSSYNLIVANTQNSSFTTTSTTKYIKLRTGVSNVENDLTSLWQLEKGTQATSYSPYFTPIELNKIGDYEDRIYKDNGKWYVEKQIGKVVLDGSESGWSYNVVNQVFIVPDLVNYLRSGFVPYSNYYQGQSVTLYNQVETNHIAFLQSTTQSRLLIKNLNYTGVDAFKTWLSTHNTEVLYVLNTPTDTQITNTELIEDLETLYTAKSQEGTTNISITSEDLEMILNVSALKSE